MGIDKEVLQVGALFAVVLAGFFVAGFAAHSFMAPSTPTGDLAADTDKTEVLSQDEAAQKAVDKLEAGPLSYPFTYNVSTVSVTNDTRIPGTTFYSTTVSYVVEPNPFEGAIYSVPENETGTTKTLTLYVSQDGNFMFQNEPIPTEVEQQQAPTGQLP